MRETHGIRWSQTVSVVDLWVIFKVLNFSQNQLITNTDSAWALLYWFAQYGVNYKIKIESWVGVSWEKSLIVQAHSSLGWAKKHSGLGSSLPSCPHADAVSHALGYFLWNGHWPLHWWISFMVTRWGFFHGIYACLERRSSMMGVYFVYLFQRPSCDCGKSCGALLVRFSFYSYKSFIEWT